MKKKSFIVYLSLIVIMLLCFFVGCKPEEENQETILKGKISDVLLTINDTEYDFYENISFVDKNGKKMEFTCDTSGVEFGKPGKYVLTYLVGELKYERLVYIYGTPTITLINQTISYENVFNGDFSSCVEAKDTFGVGLSCTLKSEPTYTMNGALATGVQSFEFETVDSFGNKATATFQITIENSNDAFAVQEVRIDYAVPYYTVEIGNRQLISVYSDGIKLGEEYYIANNGYLMLTPEFALNFGEVNKKEIYLNFNTCSAKVLLTITDSQPTAYQEIGDISTDNYLLDSIEFPFLEKTQASVQDVVFEYYIEFEGTETLLMEPIFVPKEGGEYTFIAKVYRNGILEEEKAYPFEVFHYAEKIVDLNQYIAVGEEYNFAVRTDLKDITIDYSIIDNDKILQINGQILTAIKEGSACVRVDINGGEIVEEFEFTAVDFYNTQGKTRDIAESLDFWSAENNTSVTYVNDVSDLRTSGQKYSYNALKATQGVSLKADVIEAARKVGYKYLSFTMLIEKENSALSIYSQNDVTTNLITNIKNEGKWQYSLLALDKIEEYADLLFDVNGANLYLAKVEFVGADISDYAKNYIKASATEGRSEDLTVEALQKMFSSVSNTATLTYGTTKANESYVKLTKNGYLSQNYLTHNQIRISSEWIMAAKQLGYEKIRIGFTAELSDYQTASVLRVGVDGKVYGANTVDSGYRLETNKTEGLTFDISDFQEGESIVIACTGMELAILKVYFATGPASVPYWNHIPNAS